MNTAQTIVKNTASLLVLGILGYFLVFLSEVYLARILGPEGFGKIKFAWSIVIYFTLIANLGLPVFGTREIARDRNKIMEYFTRIISLRLCLAVLSFGLLAIITILLDKPSDIKYLLVLYGLMLVPVALLLDWVFQAMERMEFIGLGRMLMGASYLGLAVLLVKSPEQILLVPVTWVSANLIFAAALIIIFIKIFGKPPFRLRFDSWKGLIKQAVPIGISMILIQVIYYIDTVMLGFMRTEQEVGFYNAAYQVILALTYLVAAYQDAIFPVISNYYKTSLDMLRRLQSYTSKLMVTLAIPLAIGGTILAEPIMNVIFGDRYANGVIALRILVWAVAFTYISTTYARGLWAGNKQGTFLMVITIQSLVNIVINLALIPPLGMMGAAIGTVSAEIIGLPLYYRGFKKIVAAPFHGYILKPLIASVVMGMFLYWGLHGLNLNVFVLVFGGIFIYFLSLFILKGITREELKSLRSLLKPDER